MCGSSKTFKRGTTKDYNDLRSVERSLKNVTRKVQYLRDSIIEDSNDGLLSISEDELDRRVARIEMLDNRYRKLLKQRSILRKKFGEC